MYSIYQNGKVTSCNCPTCFEGGLCYNREIVQRRIDAQDFLFKKNQVNGRTGIDLKAIYQHTQKCMYGVILPEDSVPYMLNGMTPLQRIANGYSV